MAFPILWLVAFLVGLPLLVFGVDGVPSLHLDTDRPADMSALPCELVTCVLLLACGDLFHPTEGRYFARTRRFISHTCQRWRKIVLSCSAFWSKYNVRPYEAKDAVHFHVSQFRNAALHLRIRFIDYYFSRCHSKIPRLEMLSPRPTLEAVIPYLHNCESLVMVLEDQNAFPMLMEALSHVEGLLLETLVLTRIVIAELVTHAAPPFIGTIFSARLPKLRNLYLTRATIGWTAPVGFAAIDTLVISSIGSPYQPTQRQLGAVIEAATVLRRMSLRSVAFTASSDDDSLPIFTSLSIVELDLHFEGDRTMSGFVNRLHLPALQSVSVQINSVDDVFCVSRCADLLRTVIKFTVSTLPIFTEYLYRYPWERVELCYMLQKLPAVQRMDLVRAGPHFFPAMLMGDSTSHRALETLAISQGVVRHIREFLEARVKMDSLPPLALELHDLNRLDDDEGDLEAVEALAGPGRLAFDPDYHDTLDWLKHQA
ncbi:hypothetical protein DFH06DRAFT_1334348 [Mycena polygramma]|nr:hypothetical protein DFH06DRAFT_1334348 [Mycena polygramma]